MGIPESIVIFLSIWVIVFFMALPWGVRVNDAHEIGHATSAPENPNFRLKALVTTFISAILLGVVLYVDSLNIITFRT